MRNFLLLFLCVFSSAVFAEQVKLAADNQTVHAKIAAKELSHIYVEDDRIVNVRGIEGAYDIKKDEAQGAIFIQPSPQFQTKSFNVFLATELGHNYNLFLTAVDMPGQDIKLKPITSAKKAAERWETSSAYEQTLLHLIAAMHDAQHPEGYAVVAIGKVLPESTPALKVILRTRFIGKHLTGEVLRINNTGKNSLTLNAQHFMTINTRALSLLSTDIAPQQSTYVYRVVSNDH